MTTFIYQLRMQRGQSLREFSEDLGISHHTIHRLERGERSSTRPSTRRRLEVALDFPFDLLISDLDAQAPKLDMSRAVFEAHRKRIEASDSAHPLARRRIRFHAGLTVAELSERSTVSKSVIHAIEAYDAVGSDRTWQRLCLALGCDRKSIDPTRA